MSIIFYLRSEGTKGFYFNFYFWFLFGRASSERTQLVFYCRADRRSEYSQSLSKMEKVLRLFASRAIFHPFAAQSAAVGREIFSFERSVKTVQWEELLVSRWDEKKRGKLNIFLINGVASAMEKLRLGGWKKKSTPSLTLSGVKDTFFSAPLEIHTLSWHSPWQKRAIENFNLFSLALHGKKVLS